ncbi:hypothetical protein, partial [Streptomyces albus]
MSATATVRLPGADGGLRTYRPRAEPDPAVRAQG